jgi:hypothetical protein
MAKSNDEPDASPERRPLARNREEWDKGLNAFLAELKALCIKYHYNVAYSFETIHGYCQEDGSVVEEEKVRSGNPYQEISDPTPWKYASPELPPGASPTWEQIELELWPFMPLEEIEAGALKNP